MPCAFRVDNMYYVAFHLTGEDVAIKDERPDKEPIIYRDLFLFCTLASSLSDIIIQKLRCNVELIVDEFGKKLLEELDYHTSNIEDILENFKMTLLSKFLRAVPTLPSLAGVSIQDSKYALFSHQFSSMRAYQVFSTYSDKRRIRNLPIY
ncbi:hypothetical protein L6164_015832 [Bauhinia variegata]|uniref:Uncharacterized protein n=1 Tax=Bauhinia variegata TaxID=167791 RepID=A0ACB9NML0_BAUVA|nr:hypothetical protein L6164_015832 [Bauhinia variegata]